MPFNNISEFEKSFPAIKNLTAKQKRAALEIFNTSMDDGDDEETAIKKAIGAAKNIEAADMKKIKELSDAKNCRVMTLGPLDFQVDEEFDDMALTQKKFEILRVGEFFDERYGKFKITEDRLHRLKENFDKNVVQTDIAIDLNHDPTKGAFAWINSLEVVGGKLFMTLKDITEEGRRILKEKVFKYFSVEFTPFDTIVDGRKTTIDDVLRGVALTNRPVIKGMQPTFLSEDANKSLINTRTMSLIMKFAEDLLARDEVSKADATFLRARFDETPEEEKTEEVEEKVAEVEAKAEEAEAEAGEAEGESSEAPAEAAEADAGEGEAGEPEAVEASEVSLKLAETQKQVSVLLAEKKERETTDRVAALTLSETTKRGFTKESGKDLHGFIATLSEDQFKAFQGLVTRVVDATSLSEEIGSSDPGEPDSEEAKLKEAKTLSEKYEAEGVAKHIAMERAQREIFNK